MHSDCILTQHPTPRFDCMGSTHQSRIPAILFERLFLLARAAHFSNSCSLDTLSEESMPVRKFDGYHSSQSQGSKSYEASDSRLHTANTGLLRMERRYWELRLNRALRRFQEQIRFRLQRRCELRIFVVLRMQFVFRTRSRSRAAVVIQRFVRSKILSRTDSQIQYSY